MTRRFFQGLLPFVGILALSAEASAQEIQVTGPLAGAPPVRQLRLHRKGRFELAPSVSFTLLDEYQRTILVGANLNYNITDWLGVGAWGSFGAVKLTTGLTDKIQETNDLRFDPNRNPDYNKGNEEAGRRLTALNVGKDFKAQLGAINWVFAPQLTLVPFRGKLAIFEKLFVDTDFHFFVGPAFVGLTERAPCGSGTSIDCSERDDSPAGPGTGTVKTKPTESRVAIAPTFGLGFSFFAGSWTSFNVDWRALPYSWNTGGYDIRGKGDGERFPDNKVNDKDREFKFNQMVSLSFSMFFPREIKVSELFPPRLAPRGPPGASPAAGLSPFVAGGVGVDPEPQRTTRPRSSTS